MDGQKKNYCINLKVSRHCQLVKLERFHNNQGKVLKFAGYLAISFPHTIPSFRNTGSSSLRNDVKSARNPNTHNTVKHNKPQFPLAEKAENVMENENLCEEALSTESKMRQIQWRSQTFIFWGVPSSSFLSERILLINLLCIHV
jgi:hypothetical protein